MTFDPRRMRVITDSKEENAYLEDIVRGHAWSATPIRILEAGCGRKWELDLTGLDHIITGIDLDSKALAHRRDVVKDLQEAIVDDIRTAALPPSSFDVVYSAFVLEHVQGADKVLANFFRWLRPGGLLILRIPDRDSAYGFVTRMTPHWVHIAFKRYAEGLKEAGKPGFGPYPTYYEKCMSRGSIVDQCQRSGLRVRDMFGTRGQVVRKGLGSTFFGIQKLSQIASIGRLSGDHMNLTVIIEKPI